MQSVRPAFGNPFRHLSSIHSGVRVAFQESVAWLKSAHSRAMSVPMLFLVLP